MNEYKGIYVLPEVTEYLYVTSPDKFTRYSTLRRWIRYEIFTPEAHKKSSKDLIINFEELVSLRMIVALRTAGFSLKNVREANDWLIRKTGYRYPFALKDLWISNTEIFIDLEGFFSVTKKGQFSFGFLKNWLKQLRRPYCTSPDLPVDLSFEYMGEREVASKWIPYQCVTLNPLIQFGSPCIEDTRIPTKSVYSMFLGGDSPKSISRSYGVPLFKIELALEWEKKIAAITG